MIWFYQVKAIKCVENDDVVLVFPTVIISSESQTTATTWKLFKISRSE